MTNIWLDAKSDYTGPVFGECCSTQIEGAVIVETIIVFLKSIKARYNSHRKFVKAFTHTVAHEVLHKTIDEEIGLEWDDECEFVIEKMVNNTTPMPKVDNYIPYNPRPSNKAYIAGYA